MWAGWIACDIQGFEKQRLKPEELLARFEELRREEQLDETAAETLQRQYV